MYLLGYSPNNLTLMALTISTGFVVDDAIVMIENIDRYLEAGDSPLDAALKGSGQIGFTIVSLTVSLIAVLIPLLFMGDIVGRLFREFAVTLAASRDSGFGRRVTDVDADDVRQTAEASQGRREGPFLRSHGRLLQPRDRVLRAHRKIRSEAPDHDIVRDVWNSGTYSLPICVIVPKGFFPVQDTGVILGVSEAPDFISFDALAQRQQELAKIILQDKAVDSLSSFIGVDGTNTTPNEGRIQINLKPRDDRADDASAIIRRLQPQLAKVDGITLYMQPVQDLTVEDRVSRTQFQYSIEDADANELAQWTPKLVAKLQTFAGVDGCRHRSAQQRAQDQCHH